LGSADSRDHCGLGFEIPGAEEEMWRGSEFEGVEWWRFEELEIPEEIDELITEPMRSSSISVSTSAGEDSSLSPSASAEGGSQGGSQSKLARVIQAPKNTTSVNEWLCGYPNCRRSFTHRYRLKYNSPQSNRLPCVSQLTMLSKHQKYHNKLHRCLESSCLARGVTFSREQDLIRHQSQHDGRRFYCTHSNCEYEIYGANNGFTRKDNLKRHLTNQHRYSQP
jgi:hypothetical protein